MTVVTPLKKTHRAHRQQLEQVETRRPEKKTYHSTSVSITPTHLMVAKENYIVSRKNSMNVVTMNVTVFTKNTKVEGGKLLPTGKEYETNEEQ